MTAKRGVFFQIRLLGMVDLPLSRERIDLNQPSGTPRKTNDTRNRVKIMIAIVLVGGKHNIISETNPLLPLGLVPIAGEPVISWITKWLKQQGFKHIIF